MTRRGWLLIAAGMLGACTGSDAFRDAAEGSGADAAGPDVASPADAAGPDAACTPGCHWDCFGGSECVDGVAWVNAFAPRDCCTTSDPWPGLGPVCSLSAHGCEGHTCGAPDPRYDACLARLGTAAEPCPGADCELVRLYCPEGAAQSAGAPCSADADCRPASEGVARLRCDTAATHTCVVDARPVAPEGFGASCGLALADVPWLQGEAVVASAGAGCALCQVARGDGCLRQACTTSCTFDEDCPAGTVCLCGAFGSPVTGYCAAATDRDTVEGRAAGLPACG